MRSCDDRAPDVLLVSALGWSTPFAAVALNRAPSHGTPSTKENVRTGNYPLVGKAAGVSINPFANVAHAFMSKSTGLGFFSATFRQQQRESRKHRHGLPWKHATRKHTYRKCRQRYYIFPLKLSVAYGLKTIHKGGTTRAAHMQTFWPPRLCMPHEPLAVVPTANPIDQLRHTQVFGRKSADYPLIGCAAPNHTPHMMTRFGLF